MTSPNWAPLKDELAHWRSAQKDLPLWWRDDDAIAPTAALDQLCEMAIKHQIPLHLAVIPQGATPALARHCGDGQKFPVLIHGFAHVSHSHPPAKKSEFGDDRPTGIRLGETSWGLNALRGLFANACLPVFVPPWNRIAADMAPALKTQGFQALSTFGPRPAPPTTAPPKTEPPMAAAPAATTTPQSAAHMRYMGKFQQLNTHLDPIDWRGTRSALDTDRLIAQIVRQLHDRRIGRADNGEPYGLLTHHLVHDSAIWNFCDTLLGVLLDGGARPVHLREILPTKGGTK
jgi:hypothetical protein